MEITKASYRKINHAKMKGPWHWRRHTVFHPFLGMTIGRGWYADGEITVAGKVECYGIVWPGVMRDLGLELALGGSGAAVYFRKWGHETGETKRCPEYK